MKILLVFPPIYYNVVPSIGHAILFGMLTEQGYNVSVFDLNSAFQSFVLNKDFLTYFEKRVNFYHNLLPEIGINNTIENKIELLSYIKNIRDTYYSVKNFLSSFYGSYYNVQEKIKDVFKQEGLVITQKFYRFEKIVENVLSLNQQNIDKIPREYSFLYEWELEYLNKIKILKPDILCVSLFDEVQFDYVLPLTKYLKKFNIKKIFYGGNYITLMRNYIPSEIFDDNVDVCIYGEGEIALAKLVKGEPLDEIPNIIYSNNHKIIVNPVQVDKTKKIYKPNYDGFNFSEYLTPEPIVSLECSRGCYWNKCEFCVFNDCKNYKHKKVDDLIDEVKEYISKYNINKIIFSDVSVHPKLMEEFSRKLIENNLKIYYGSFMRLEKEFDYNLLKLMYDAGLRAAFWGVESGSDRILKLLNKGTEVSTNARILKDAHEIGISNFCTVMTNIPGEKYEDVTLTKKFFMDNYDNIDYVAISEFAILNNAPMVKHLKDFELDENLLNNKREIFNKPKDKNLENYIKEVFEEISLKYKTKNDAMPEDMILYFLKTLQLKH